MDSTTAPSISPTTSLTLFRSHQWWAAWTRGKIAINRSKIPKGKAQRMSRNLSRHEMRVRIGPERRASAAENQEEGGDQTKDDAEGEVGEGQGGSNHCGSRVPPDRLRPDLERRDLPKDRTPNPPALSGPARNSAQEDNLFWSRIDATSPQNRSDQQDTHRRGIDCIPFWLYSLLVGTVEVDMPVRAGGCDGNLDDRSGDGWLSGSGRVRRWT